MAGVTESPWRDRERLQRLYINEGLTVAEIGDRLGCADTTVCDWLDRHDIDTRDPDPPTMEGEDHPRAVTRDELTEEYQNLAVSKEGGVKTPRKIRSRSQSRTGTSLSDDGNRNR